MADYDWRAVLRKPGPKFFRNAVTGAVNYLRDSTAPGNATTQDGAQPMAVRFRKVSGQLARAWALSTGTGKLEELRPEVQVHEEIRVWMGKFDAQNRQARGEPVPEEIQRILGQLIATATDDTGEVLDIYEAAGMPKPSLSDLTPEFIAKTQKARNPQLAIEALRKLIADESKRTTKNNVIRQRAFSDRITELMNKYTNQQLTSAEVIAELVEMAKEALAEADRGKQFSPPLDYAELTFYDAITQNESAVEIQGAGKLAEIARQLVEVMRRDVRTDWTVREDVRAKPRSSVKRLLMLNGYPPDETPEVIKLVIEQME